VRKDIVKYIDLSRFI